MKLNEYQSLASKTDETGRAAIALYGLVGEIGGLFSLLKKRARDRQPSSQFNEDLAEELGDVMWYVAALASKYGLSLQQIAESNIAKTTHLFTRADAVFFDTDFPEQERLPQQGVAEFSLDPITDKAIVKIDGKIAGDALSDNVLNEDDYRFHDAFHLSFLVHLHWSPTYRRLLKRKRKSSTRVDEGQDGARAAIVEEAAIGIIFSYAEQNSFFPEKGGIPFSLVKILQRLTSKYEVSVCTADQWRDAIFDGCRVFIQLASSRGGKVDFDAVSRKLMFTE